MIPTDDRVRSVIAERASEWFVANDDAPLGPPDASALVGWLKASPAHIEEFLGVSEIARDLHALDTDAEFPMDELLERARAGDDVVAPSIGYRTRAVAGLVPHRRRRFAVWAAGALAAAGIAALGVLHMRQAAPVTGRGEPTALQFTTPHGGQRTVRLEDASELHLNTDSSVTVLYSPTQRLVVLTAGEVQFEVAHESARPFRVRAGRAEIVDLGTTFDVRIASDATVVTVADGEVAVGPRAADVGDAGPASGHPWRSVRVGANQQLSLTDGSWPAAPINVDAQRTTAWLHRQVVFDHETLERVAAEINRYAPVPIEISSPELRTLEVSGIFSTDDPEEFLAFLRSLEGVRIDATKTRIRVSRK